MTKREDGSQELLVVLVPEKVRLKEQANKQRSRNRKRRESRQVEAPRPPHCPEWLLPPLSQVPCLGGGQVSLAPLQQTVSSTKQV